MAASKKKKRNKKPQKKSDTYHKIDHPEWRLPEPTPGDEIHRPTEDMAPHIREIAARIAQRDVNRNYVRRPSSFAKIKSHVTADVTDQYMDLALRLNRDYFRRLAQRPETLTPEQIEKMDVIDLSAMSSDEIPMGAYLKELVHTGKPIYAVMPCFLEGIVLTPQRHTLRFCVTRIDETAGQMDIHMEVYQAYPTTDGTLVRISSGDITIQASPGTTPDGEETVNLAYTTRRSIVKGPVDTLTRIPPTELPWSSVEKELWEEIILQNAVDQEARWKNHGFHDVFAATSEFTRLISITNFLLSNHRPVLIKEPSDKPAAKRQATTKPKTAEKTRSVRTVGPIRVISVRPPKAPNEKTIRNYVTAAWTVRGHTRTYKSGKTVYIKPGTRRRRSMDAANAAPMPSTIRVRPGSKGGTVNGQIQEKEETGQETC